MYYVYYDLKPLKGFNVDSAAVNKRPLFVFFKSEIRGFETLVEWDMSKIWRRKNEFPSFD